MSLFRLSPGLLALFLCTTLAAQSDTHAPLPMNQAFRSMNFDPVEAFSLTTNPLVLQRPARINQTFSVTGERGAILGQQDGSFELWLFPVKLLHKAHLTARLKDYDAVIDLNAQAASVEVRPDHTTITYAHAAITVKQHMFVPRGQQPGNATAVVLFEVHSPRPAEITLAFEPTMERQWPAPNFGRPDGEWIPAGSGGAYLLATDNPGFFGVVAMPQATHGHLRPFQERPASAPLTFTFSYTPGKDDGHFFPLLCSVSDPSTAKPSDRRSMLEQTFAQESRIGSLYRSTADYYNQFFDDHLSTSTADRRFDDALKWAAISIEQSRIAQPEGAGLAGGWFTSGDSARPGFGWFFGRDTLWTLYAVNSYGNFKLSREAMNFLLSHQREDGKMMHEYSQTAGSVDWQHLPYLYASADSTPLFVMQIEDYVRSSGDVDYLKQHWNNVKRAYAFTRAHTMAGGYSNSQGTGWVEEWLPHMPQQEIYLVALDQQSSDAMASMAHWMDDEALAASARSTSASLRSLLAKYRGSGPVYAFSRNADGSLEEVPSIFPSVAWWSGHEALTDAAPMFQAWAGAGFSTDWGTRSVSTDAAIYDPISYHHGSVWPLYTGWVSMAEYRTGNSLSAYAHLADNIRLTTFQDPGAITEVLSGSFYENLGRSSSHQLWSSAMVLAPAVRGLFGLEADAVHHVLHLNPSLPAGWDGATLHHVGIGNQLYEVSFRRQQQQLLVEVTGKTATQLCLRTTPDSTAACTETPSVVHRLALPLPAVEVGLPEENPAEGEATRGLRVLKQDRTPRSLTLLVEASAGSTQVLTVRRNAAGPVPLHVEGAALNGAALTLNMPPQSDGTTGYQQHTLRLTW
ncbi:MAG: amylo-alpha-1,6-glucosidase [Janthinobacterium lividum]